MCALSTCNWKDSGLVGLRQKQDGESTEKIKPRGRDVCHTVIPFEECRPIFKTEGSPGLLFC